MVHGEVEVQTLDGGQCGEHLEEALRALVLDGVVHLRVPAHVQRQTLERSQFVHLVHDGDEATGVDLVVLQVEIEADQIGHAA